MLTGLYNRIVKGEDVDSGMVDAVIQMSAEPMLDGIIRKDVSEPPAIMIRTRKKTIVPRSATQDPVHDGAGVGRRDLRAWPRRVPARPMSRSHKAVQMLIQGQVTRLILSRPAVEAE